MYCTICRAATVPFAGFLLTHLQGIYRTKWVTDLAHMVRKRARPAGSGCPAAAHVTRATALPQRNGDSSAPLRDVLIGLRGLDPGAVLVPRSAASAPSDDPPSPPESSAVPRGIAQIGKQCHVCRVVRDARSVRTFALKTCGELFRGAQLNILLTLLISAAFGSVRFQPGGVLIVDPTLTDYIWITGLIFGLILGVLVTRGTVKGFRAAVAAAGPDAAEATSDAPTHSGATLTRTYPFLPRKTWALTVAVCVIAMALSMVALPTILRVFHIAQLNFAQFIVFITLYSWLISKLFSYLLVKRMLLPDYMNQLR